MGVRFRHQVIDPNPPGAQMDITLLADIDGDGHTDIVIGSKAGEVNLWWYKNPSWERYPMAVAPNLEAGGVVLDINRDGRPDIVAGMQYGGRELYWFENPPDPTKRWTKRIIENRFQKYHDQTAGDLDGDGELEILFASQQSGVIAYYDIPSDPTRSPWPEDHCHILADDMPNIEGLVIADLDDDGVAEAIAGPNLFRRGRGGRWTRTPLLDGWVMTRVAVGDLDADGELEIVLSEGESEPGRLGIYKLSTGELRILNEGLFHPHSLEVQDFTGDGRLDIFVGEMGLGKNLHPRLILYRNLGDEFEEIVFHEGTPVHEAKAADLNGDGKPEIVGKPYHPERHVDIWWNETP